MKLKPEDQLQSKCNQWLSFAYPELDRQYLFNSMQGMRLNFPQIAKQKLIGGLKPNILDFYLHKNNGSFGMLAIELKAEIPFRKDNKLFKDDHLEAQAETIELLLIENYYACFVWSFDQFKSIFINYLDNTLPKIPQIIKKNGVYYYNLV